MQYVCLAYAFNILVSRQVKRAFVDLALFLRRRLGDAQASGRPGSSRRPACLMSLRKASALSVRASKAPSKASRLVPQSILDALACQADRGAVFAGKQSFGGKQKGFWRQQVRGEREREKQLPIHTLLPLLLSSGSSPADLLPPLQQILSGSSSPSSPTAPPSSPAAPSSSPAAPHSPPVQQLLLLSSTAATSNSKEPTVTRYTSLPLLPHPPLLSFFFAGCSLLCASCFAGYSLPLLQWLVDTWMFRIMHDGLLG